MGLLDHLWDDTVAGPPPDSGHGKFSKNAAFSSRPNSGKEAEVVSNGRSFAEEVAEDVRVTRSIMIVKPPQASYKDSPPASPGGSTPPVSPFSGGGGGREAFRYRRRSASFAYEKASVGRRPRNPTPPYDV